MTGMIDEFKQTRCKRNVLERDSINDEISTGVDQLTTHENVHQQRNSQQGNSSRWTVASDWRNEFEPTSLNSGERRGVQSGEPCADLHDVRPGHCRFRRLIHSNFKTSLSNHAMGWLSSVRDQGNRGGMAR